MHRLHEAPAYDTTRWPQSHWRASRPPPLPRPPLTGEQTAEVAIVGAGYAGLNAALELVERHGSDVAVIEAAQPGWGASGRNGGFACLGGAKLSDAAIAARVGNGGAQDFRDFQHDAVDRVAENLATYRIEARQGPEGEICLAHSRTGLAELAEEAATRRRLYGETTEMIPAGALRERGLSGAGFAGAAFIAKGFPLHPLAYAEGLAEAALTAGVRIYGGSPVAAFLPERGSWRVVTRSGTLLARRVLIATNGYSSEDVPPWLGGRTLPAMSSILVTRPTTAAEREAQGFTAPFMSYDTRRLLHYFRLLPDGRFLFGMRGGITATAAATARTAARTRAHFERMFPAWRGVETETTWSGMVCLTGSLTPYVGPVPGAEGLYAALGWHGNGVAPATLGGRLAAELLAGAPARIPALMQQPPKKFPFPSLRRLWLRGAYLAYGLKDGQLP